MNNIDEKILNAITQNHDESNTNYQKELGLFGLIRESFKGSHKWVVVAVFLLIFIFIGLTIYSAYHFYYATEITTKLNWMAVVIVGAIIVSILRLWYFMELNRLSMKREIKRLELQVSLLVKKLNL